MFASVGVLIVIWVYLSWGKSLNKLQQVIFSASTSLQCTTSVILWRSWFCWATVPFCRQKSLYSNNEIFTHSVLYVEQLCWIMFGPYFQRSCTSGNQPLKTRVIWEIKSYFFSPDQRMFHENIEHPLLSFPQHFPNSPLAFWTLSSSGIPGTLWKHCRKLFSQWPVRN